MNIKELLEEVETEDSLPSNAGNLFRDVLRYEIVGWRELDIVRKWLSFYLDGLNHEQREEVKDKLIIE